MSIDLTIAMVILGMALATYSTRASGYFLVRRLTLGPFARRFMEQSPGAMFAALCAPSLLEARPLEWVGVAATVGLMRQTGNLLVALLGGVGAVAMLRLAFA